MTKSALLRWALIWAAIASGATAPSAAAGMCGAVAPTEGSQGPSAAAVMRLAKDWVATVNSAADDAAYLRFVQERGPVLGDGMDPLLFRDFLRGMEVCGVKSAGADAVEMWVFDPNMDAYGIWRFKAGPTEGDKIRFLGGRSPKSFRRARFNRASSRCRR